MADFPTPQPQRTIFRKLVLTLTLLLGLGAPAIAGAPIFSNDGSMGPANGIIFSANRASMDPIHTGSTATGAIVGTFDDGTVGASESSALRDEEAARAAITISTTDYCNAAQMNGSADATPCLQAATNALCVRNPGGGRLFLQAGQYTIARTSTWHIPCSGIEIAGAGIGDRNAPTAVGTEIGVDASGTLPAIKVQAPASPGSNFAIGFAMHDLAMVQGGNDKNFRSGPFIDIYSFEGVSLHNLYLYATCIGVRITGGQSVYITNMTNHAYKPGANCHAFYLTGNETGISKPGGAGPFTLDVVKFENVVADGPARGSCYRIVDRVHTVWWSNATCETSGSGIKVDCPTMTNALDCPGFFTLQDLEIEYFGTNAENLIDVIDMVAGFKMTQSWLRGFNGGNFVNNLLSFQQRRFTSTNLLTVSISDSWLKGAGGDAVYVNAPGAMTITGNHIYGASHFNASAFGGVTLDTKAKGVSIVSNVFCGGDWLTDIGNRMTGIRILGVADYITVTGNVFQGDISPPSGQHNSCSSALSNTSSGTHTTATGNVGP